MLHAIERRKANWIGHILRRNCLQNGVIEGKIKEWIEVTGRWERRRKLPHSIALCREFAFEEAMDLL